MGKKMGTARVSHEQVAIALIKHLGIREGHWQMGYVYTQEATNVQVQDQTLPAVFNVLTGVELLQVAEANALSVDAAEVNPAPTRIM